MITCKNCLGIFILLFFSSALFAQRDYAIDMKGDTIRGKVKRPILGKLRIETKDSKINMTPDSISLYYYSVVDETWCSRVLPGGSKPVFMQRVVNGAIRLYTYTFYHGNNLTSVSMYAEKDNISLDEIKSGAVGGSRADRKDFFRSLIADNADLVKPFDEENKFTNSYLKKLATEYNQQAAGKNR